MARRPLRRLTALLALLAVTACTAVSGRDTPESTTATDATTITVPSPPASSSTSTTTTTTTLATTTTNSGATPTTSLPEPQAEVKVPEGEGPFPAVVLAHGGGWIVGNPSIMRPLATHLTDNGFLTVNTEYQLATFDTPGFPEAVDDVACAVRYAASHPDSDGTVAVVGHSAGAHIGALVALTGDQYATDCPYPGEGVPERFVGLAGPYDVSRLGIAVVAFFGAGPDAIPDVWEAGNPQLLTDENTRLESLIMYGDEDGIVADSFAVDFANALQASGSTALLEQVEGARHQQMHDPGVVGDLIATWLER